MKRLLENKVDSTNKTFIAADNLSDKGDDGLHSQSKIKNIALAPVLCSTSSTNARISNPCHLQHLYLNEETRTALGFGADNAVVLPLITSFRCPGTVPDKFPEMKGAHEVALFAENVLEHGCVFVDSDNMESQIAHEMAWLSSGCPHKSLVSRPVLLPVMARRFVRAAECKDPEKWGRATSSFYRPGEHASKIVDLSVTDESSDCATCFAVRWERLVHLFVPTRSDKQVCARMLYMLGIPPDSPAVYNIWPISKETAEGAIANGTDVSKAARGLATGGVRWKLRHAHLPIWFVPVFLSAVNAVMNEEIHNVQHALMQITGQLSVLSAYENQSQEHAARALERVFSTVEVIKRDTAMHLVDAAFSVGPVLQSIVHNGDRIDHLENALAESEARNSACEKRATELESRLLELTNVVEALTKCVIPSSI